MYMLVMVMTTTVLAFEISDKITHATNVKFELLAEISRLSNLCTNKDLTQPLALIDTVGVYFKDGHPLKQVDGMT